MLATEALRMALARRRPSPGLIHDSEGEYVEAATGSILTLERMGHLHDVGGWTPPRAS